MRAPRLRVAFLQALLACGLMAGLAGRANAAWDPAPTPSTGPIGGTFYRRLAYDFNLDLHELVKLERRGFGRNEVVTLVLISSTTGVSVKDYAKRRIKDKVLLKDLAAEAGLDYPTLMRNAETIKRGIEARGEENLPPPVFEPSPSPVPRPGRKKKKDKSAQPSPTPAALPAPPGAPPATSPAAVPAAPAASPASTPAKP